MFPPYERSSFADVGLMGSFAQALLLANDEAVLETAVAALAQLLGVQGDLIYMDEAAIAIYPLVQYVALEQQLVYASDLAVDPRWGMPDGDLFDLYATGSAVGLPIWREGQLAAAFLFTHGQPHAFPDDTLRFLDEASHLVSSAWVAAEQRSTREQHRRDVMAMITHDMRAPLQNIQMAYGALHRSLINLRRPEDTASLHDLIELGEASARHLSKMAQNLLDLARLEGTTATLKRERVSVAAVIDEACALIVGVAAQAGHQLMLNITPDLQDVIGDEDLLRRVLVNLIDNAIKHTPSGGRIIAGGCPGERDGERGVCLTVVDSGLGVPAQLRDEIFERYFRLRSHDGNGGRDGVGLGLAFCKMAVEAQGGTIWVEDAAGGGACFAVWLPAAPAREREVARTA